MKLYGALPSPYVAANGEVVSVPREPATWGVTLRKNF